MINSSIKYAFTLTAALLSLSSVAQDKVKLKEVKVTRERSLMTPQGLYGNNEAMPPHIGNVFQLDIFKDQIGSEIWYTKTVCLDVQQNTDLAPGNETGMTWKWDKQREGGCGTDWIGLGIGWDGWAAKDIFGIMDSAAIRLRVKSTGGDIKGLPLAACLEDYSDKQAWIGLSPDRIENAPIVDNEWRDVVLPLNAFGWDENNCNPSNIKQLIIQFEAGGALTIDKIDLIRRPAPPRLRTECVLTNDTLILDGIADPSLERQPSMELPSGKAIWLTANRGYLSFFMEAPVNDKRGKIKKLDLVVSSNPEASIKRDRRLMSDHWFSTEIEGECKSASLNIPLSKSGSKLNVHGDMQSVEWIINTKEALFSGFKEGDELLFDIMITYDRNGEEVQEIWNCHTAAFGEVPLRWGFMDIKLAEN